VAWFLGQSIVFIVLAFLLGLLVGWIIWGRLSPEIGCGPVGAGSLPGK
jgi:hypothetical protein